MGHSARNGGMHLSSALGVNMHFMYDFGDVVALVINNIWDLNAHITVHVAR